MAANLQWAVFALLVTTAACFPPPAQNASLLASASASADAFADASDCVLPGLFCLDCQTLAVCVEIQDKFVHYVMADCTSAEPCSQSLKACSDKSSFCTTGGTFGCTQPGFFPDPFDCNVYHECGEPPAHDPDEYSPLATHTCDINTAYDPRSERCDLAEADAKCGDDSYPVPLCESLGVGVTSGAFDLDPSYYWMCVSGVVRVLKCKEGFVYDENTLRCVRAGDSSEETTTETTSQPPEGFQCSGTGREPDPSSCTKYYDCSDPGNPVHLSCLWGKYYHQRKGRCVLGFCSN